MPGEQDPSRFEALKQGIAERFDGIKQSFNNTKAVGEIAAVGVGATLGLVGGVAMEQASTEPAYAANVPEATASASSLDRSCINTGLAVKIFKPTIYYAGIVGSQASGASMLYKKSSKCAQEGYEHTSKGLVQAKRPDQDHWRALGSHLKRLKFLRDPYFPNKREEAGLVERTTPQDKEGSPKYIKPGECARVLVVNTVTLHNKPVASRRVTKPAKVFDGSVVRADAADNCF